MPESMVTALIAAAVSVIGTSIGIIATTRKTRAEAQKLLADAHAIDVETMQNVMGSLASEVRRMTEALMQEETRRVELERRVDCLSEELILAKAENSNLQRENVALTNRVRELEQERLELRCEIDNLRAEVENIRAGSDRGPESAGRSETITGGP